MLMCCVLMSAVCITDAAQPPVADQQLVGVSRLNATLDINFSSGVATCTGLATAESGYSVELVVELLEDGVVIESWSGTGRIINIQETYPVTSNHEYQVIATAYVSTAGGSYLLFHTKESQTLNT